MGYKRVPNEDLKNRSDKWFVDAKQDPHSGDIMKESLTAVNLVNKRLQVQFSWQCRTCLPRSLSESAGSADVCRKIIRRKWTVRRARATNRHGVSRHRNRISPIGKPPAGKRDLICLLFGELLISNNTTVYQLFLAVSTRSGAAGTLNYSKTNSGSKHPRALKVEYSRHLRHYSN